MRGEHEQKVSARLDIGVRFLPASAGIALAAWRPPWYSFAVAVCGTALSVAPLHKRGEWPLGRPSVTRTVPRMQMCECGTGLGRRVAVSEQVIRPLVSDHREPRAAAREQQVGVACRFLGVCVCWWRLEF